MVHQDEKLQKMISEIVGEGEETGKSISEETEKWVSDELARTENEVLAETYVIIKQRSARINEKAGRAVTNAEIEARRQLFERSHAIMEETFEVCREKIAEFTNTPEYRDMLLRSADAIASKLGRCRKITIREADRKYAADIAVRLGPSVTVEIDDSIKLGGFCAFAADDSTVIDDTLDERLEAQKEWFINNSGLTII